MKHTFYILLSLGKMVISTNISGTWVLAKNVVDTGEWQSWRHWSSCSASCSDGQKSRLRHCAKTMIGQSNCPGEESQFAECKVKECPVHGIWTYWNQWSDCNNRCGSGMATRNRTCTNPPPEHGGKNCSGEQVELRSCHGLCHGFVWNDWEGWATCSVTCETGTQTRNRTCQDSFLNTEAPVSNCLQNGDRTTEEQKSCDAGVCTVWVWDSFGACNATNCNIGYKSRTQKCTNADTGAEVGDASCDGNSGTETEQCTTLMTGVHCSASPGSNGVETLFTEFDGNWDQTNLNIPLQPASVVVVTVFCKSVPCVVFFQINTIGKELKVFVNLEDPVVLGNADCTQTGGCLDDFIYSTSTGGNTYTNNDNPWIYYTVADIEGLSGQLTSQYTPRFSRIRDHDSNDNNIEMIKAEQWSSRTFQ